MIAEKQDYVEAHNLISLQRREKLDLLVQLILNQREALILCGPEGIGKTTLLKMLKNNKKHLWVICFFKATPDLNLNEIEITLISAIKAHASVPSNESLDDMLCFYEEHQQKVVVIIDNAINLEHGFIDKLINYSSKYPAIRLLFALTEKELILKEKTDKTIDNGYFIDLPALDKLQVGVFLQMLSVVTDGLITEDEINTPLLNKIHQRTQGIPGKIIDELQQGYRWLKWQKGLVFASCLIAVIALIYLYKPILEQSNLYQQLFINQPQAKIKTNHPKQKLTQTVNETIKNKKPVLNNLQQQVKDELLKIQKRPETCDDSQWVLQNFPKNYTLQLMLTPKKNALLAILAKYQKRLRSLKYIQIKRKNKQLYILLYGSFSTADGAQKIVKTLPPAFKQAWPKRFDAIQTEIKNTQ